MTGAGGWCPAGFFGTQPTPRPPPSTPLRSPFPTACPARRVGGPPAWTPRLLSGAAVELLRCPPCGLPRLGRRLLLPSPSLCTTVPHTLFHLPDSGCRRTQALLLSLPETEVLDEMEFKFKKKKNCTVQSHFFIESHSVKCGKTRKGHKKIDTPFVQSHEPGLWAVQLSWGSHDTSSVHLPGPGGPSQRGQGSFLLRCPSPGCWWPRLPGARWFVAARHLCLRSLATLPLPAN